MITVMNTEYTMAFLQDRIDALTKRNAYLEAMLTLSDKEVAQ